MQSTDRLNRSPSPSPPEAWSPIRRLGLLATRPLERFLHIEAASGILLLLAAAVALLWANSSWQHGYHELFRTPLGVRIGGFSFERSLEWVVNDGLMVIFFFVVGLEIRREIHQGELSEWRRAALPAAAALGGMLAPAGIYLLIAGAPKTHSGWGVPMATDIAFALGVLTLLGQRVPPALRVLLLALAVIDDLGAILVIALFYSSGVQWVGLAVAALGLLSILLLQWLGVRNKLAYIAPGLVAWGGTYAAGIHPTIAGVAIGLMTPVRAWYGAEGFVRGLQEKIEPLAAERDVSAVSPGQLSEVLRDVNVAHREARSPAESLIETLHPWVAFIIMPLFALANAGVTLSGVRFGEHETAVLLGAAAGLIVGKPVGILIACALVLKLGLATLPRGLGKAHLVVLGMVAGIGFTMALFVAQLAFDDAGLLGAAKLGILCASGLAGILGLAVGAVALARKHAPGAAPTADDAECSTEA
ncbi:MAG TPA: Na+/H+ antiporter NhaA [Polyangiaceae bacterium]|nr:Na+/H+ antiporter NhaA [Polyangiaceae bacterium]